MNIQLSLRALLFYRMRSVRAVQVAFVALFLARLAAAFIPFGNKDFSDLLQLSLSQNFRPEEALALLTPGHYQVMAVEGLLMLFALLISLYYAQCLILESYDLYPQMDEEAQRYYQQDLFERLQEAADGIRQKREEKTRIIVDALSKRRGQAAAQIKGVFRERFQGSLKRLGPGARQGAAGQAALLYFPKKLGGLALALLLLMLSFVLSAPFMMLPFLLLMATGLFFPYFYLNFQLSMKEAFYLSWDMSHSFRLLMMAQLLLTVFVFNALASLLALPFGEHSYSLQLIQVFVSTLRSFVMARMLGIFFLGFATKKGMQELPLSEA